MEPLRVVLATLDLAPTHGGIQTMTAQFVTHAIRSQFRVIAPADPGHETTAFPVPVRRVRAIAPGRRGFVPSVALVARRELVRGGEIGVAMHPLAALGFLGQRKPFVVLTHGGELRSPRIRRVASMVFPKAARVICNSRFTRSEAIALGADPLRTEVIPPGAPAPIAVDPETLDALRAQIGGPFLLCVARLVPHKGQDALIEVLTHLEDHRVVLIGSGPHESRLRALAQAKGVADRVVFAGRVDDSALPAYYGAASAFVLLSRAVSVGESAGVEGAGISILEAMSMGCPVIAGATGGIPETVVDGSTGVLVDPTDVRAVAQRITRLLNDPGLREHVTAEALRLVQGERSWTRFSQRLEDALLLLARSEGTS